jgi:hypothetical protein
MEPKSVAGFLKSTKKTRYYIPFVNVQCSSLNQVNSYYRLEVDETRLLSEKE